MMHWTVKEAVSMIMPRAAMVTRKWLLFLCWTLQGKGFPNKLISLVSYYILTMMSKSCVLFQMKNYKLFFPL